MTIHFLIRIIKHLSVKYLKKIIRQIFISEHHSGSRPLQPLPLEAHLK